MPKTTFDIKTEATRSLLAGVGAADLAVEAVRDYVADVSAKAGHLQKNVSKNVTGIDYDPAALRDQAVTAVNARFDALSADAKSTRAMIEARLVELQAQLQAEAKALPAKVQTLIDENVATAGETYTELAKRGEDLVGRIRKQESTQAAVTSAKTTVAKAKTTKTQATKSANVAKTAAKSTAKSTTKTAKTATKTATKTAAKKAAPVKKSAATAESSAKATVTAAKKTASTAVEAVVDAAEKIGD
ncbi:hypothetical protein [Nocardioides sp.]|uniref:hypothetical protein n=1 Tax=Nocardioides sp. TaxID=35761 RepID=UPI003D14EEF8